MSSRTAIPQRRWWLITSGMVVILSCRPIAYTAAVEAPAPPRPIPTDNIETLSRGAIHEAFAQPLSYDVQTPEVVAKAPPAAVEEVPPDVQPEGRNVQWIPGYWQWESERDDFVWISGAWRDSPPGRRWIPGYWAKLDSGYQWTAGLWVDDNAQQISYLPHPPDSLDEGPTTDSPGNNYFWIPGSWRWNSDRYLWRPGYWSLGYNNWTWVPDSYCYTPRGSIFCSGYWDYPLARRGWLFAPVYFSGNYYNRGYYYTPRNLVDVALLSASLFVNPRYNHYYYGDFYGRRGFQPWYAWHLSHRGYDPFFAYDRWRDGGRHRDWYDRLARDFRDGRRDGDLRSQRSPQDIASDFNRIRRDRGEPEFGRDTSLVRPLDRFVAERGDDKNFVRLNDNQRRAATSSAERLRRLTDGRLDGEAKDRSDMRAQRTDRDSEGGQIVRGGANRNRDIEARAQLPRNYQPRQFQLPQRDPSERASQIKESRGGQPPTSERGDNRRYEAQRPNIDRGDRGDGRGGVRRPEVQRAEVQRPEIRRSDNPRPEVQRPEVRRPDVQRPSGERSGGGATIRGGNERSSGDRGGTRSGGDRGGSVERSGGDRGAGNDRGGGGGGTDRGSGAGGGGDRGGAGGRSGGRR